VRDFALTFLALFVSRQKGQKNRQTKEGRLRYLHNKILLQKLNYIHKNPCHAKCENRNPANHYYKSWLEEAAIYYLSHYAD